MFESSPQRPLPQLEFRQLAQRLLDSMSQQEMRSTVIGDKAYGSDRRDRKLAPRCVESIAPRRVNHGSEI